MMAMPGVGLHFLRPVLSALGRRKACRGFACLRVIGRSMRGAATCITRLSFKTLDPQRPIIGVMLSFISRWYIRMAGSILAGQWEETIMTPPNSSPPPAWIKTLRSISLLCAAFGIFFYFRGPPANTSQAVFRIAVVTFGAIGFVVSLVLERRFSNRNR